MRNRNTQLTIDQARSLVERHLKEKSERSKRLEFVLLEEYTLECDFGWVFFYDSKKYLETGKTSDALAGNSPIIVDKRDGSMHTTGTARPTEYYIENYRKYGTTHPPTLESE